MKPLTKMCGLGPSDQRNQDGYKALQVRGKSIFDFGVNISHVTSTLSLHKHPQTPPLTCAYTDLEFIDTSHTTVGNVFKKHWNSAATCDTGKK